MKQNDFYEVDGCTDFIPVKLIKEHKHFTNTLEVELTGSGYKSFVPSIYSFPKVNEPQKVVVPKFVADFYESIKDDFEDKVYDLCLQFNRDNGELSSEFDGWFDCGKNEPIQTLVKMKLYGYDVEKEKLYTVEIANPNNEYSMNVLIRLPSSGKIALVALHKPNTSYLKNKEYQLTESEIKEDFEWAWQFAKEAEE